MPTIIGYIALFDLDILRNVKIAHNVKYPLCKISKIIWLFYLKININYY